MLNSIILVKGDTMLESYLIEAYRESTTWYHATPNEFDTFDMSKGDIGAHFGTLDQAYKRLNGRLGGKGHIYKVKVKVYNPLKLKDEGTFHAYGSVADQLLKKGIISKEDHSRYTSQGGYKKEITKAHNAEIRDKLKQAGYDSVTYSNTHEGKGISLIAIDPSTVKITGKYDLT